MWRMFFRQASGKIRCGGVRDSRPWGGRPFGRRGRLSGAPADAAAQINPLYSGCSILGERTTPRPGIKSIIAERCFCIVPEDERWSDVAAEVSGVVRVNFAGWVAEEVWHEGNYPDVSEITHGARWVAMGNIRSGIHLRLTTKEVLK